ncbi:MAG TPA: hypothetical protein VKH15_00945 [Candidatus Acidoferrum sp.]|nr:hypothetical protein [Candidatus Acidoferrum sp.]
MPVFSPLYQGDCLDVLAQIPPSSIDLVFADPPYFLSNGGITCHAGKWSPSTKVPGTSPKAPSAAQRPR